MPLAQIPACAAQKIKQNLAVQNQPRTHHQHPPGFVQRTVMVPIAPRCLGQSSRFYFFCVAQLPWSWKKEAPHPPRLGLLKIIFLFFFGRFPLLHAVENAAGAERSAAGEGASAEAEAGAGAGGGGCRGRAGSEGLLLEGLGAAKKHLWRAAKKRWGSAAGCLTVAL